MDFPIPSVLSFLAQAAPKPSSQATPQLIALGLLALVLSLVIHAVVNWIVSKLLVPQDNEFAKAVKLVLLTLGGSMGVAVVGAIALAPNIAALNLIAIIGCALLMLYVIFATPMGVYKIGFLRSVGFIILTWIILGIGEFAAMSVLAVTLKGTAAGPFLQAMLSRDPIAQMAYLRKAVPSAGPALDRVAAKIAADTSKPVKTRQAALQMLRDSLEARRVALNPKDPAAVAAYTRDAKEYSKWYHEVEAQAKAGAKP